MGSLEALISAVILSFGFFVASIILCVIRTTPPEPNDDRDRVIDDEIPF
jgi:hypothetical protein